MEINKILKEVHRRAEILPFLDMQKREASKLDPERATPEPDGWIGANNEALTNLAKTLSNFQNN